MKLINCHVAGFGRLSNLDLTFTDGLNTILEDNGSGKTTFCVFLKSMFYGLSYRPNVKKLTEREHYRPWETGAFGGSVTFETGKGRFRVERTFGKKKTDDTFALFDAKTGRPSDAYPEELGDVLFGVDEESFMKSVYVPQGLPETGMTDSLNAKMGGVQTARDDMNRFDSAEKRLEDAKKLYTRTGRVNPGKLTVLKEQIRAAKASADQIPDLTDAYNRAKKIRDDRRQELLTLRTEKQALGVRIKERSALEQELGAFREKESAYDKREGELADLRAFLGSDVPDEEALKSAEETRQKLKVDEKTLEDLAGKRPEPSEEKRLKELFRGGIPDDGAMEDFRSRADRLKSLRVSSEAVKMKDEDRAELGRLKEYFKNGTPSAEEIASVREAENAHQRLTGKKQEMLSRLDEAERNESAAKKAAAGKYTGIGVFSILLALVLVAGGLILPFHAARGILRFIMCASAAAELLIIDGVVLARKRRKKTALAEASGKADDLRQQIADVDRDLSKTEELRDGFLAKYPGNAAGVQERISEIQSAYDRLNHLKDLEARSLDNTSGAIDELAALQLELYTALQPYADSYGMDLYHDMNEQELLTRLDADRRRMADVLDNEEKSASIRHDMEEMKQTLLSFLRRFPSDDTEQADELLSRVRAARDRYLKLTEEQKTAGAGLEAEREKFRTPLSGETVAELQKKQEETDAEISETERLLNQDTEAADRQSDELVAREEEKDALPDLQSQQQKYQERVEILNLTMDYLKKARDRFLSGYMGPLRTGMERYTAAFSADGADAGDTVELDMDLTIRLIHNGQTHSNAYLSAGYRDLTYLAARFALIDVLYKKEQPVLILDDPFTDLDAEKTKKGLGLLQKASADRQILYFTCHRSRTTDGCNF